MPSPADLTSSRLVLRPFDEADRELYCRLYTDPAVMQAIGPVASTAHASAAFDRVRARCQDLYWSAWPHAASSPIGLAALQHVDGAAEWGVLLFPDAWGRGYAREMLDAVVDYGFGVLGLPRICVRARAGAPAHRMGRILRHRAPVLQDAGVDGWIAWRLSAPAGPAAPIGSTQPTG